MGRFIWTGAHNGKLKDKLHLAQWSHITKPVEEGGWGILDLGLFNNSLCWHYDTYVVLDGNPLISDDKL